MKINYKGLDIECTPSEFVALVDALENEEFPMSEAESNLPLWKRVFRYSESKGHGIYIGDMDINHVINALAKDIRKQKFEGIDKGNVVIRAMIERLAYELNS